MSILSIPIPADATFGDALAAANRALSVHARAHQRPYGWKRALFPRTRLLQFESDAIVYEVEDDCDATQKPQDASCCVTEAKMMNHPQCYAESGYGTAVGV